MSRDMQKVRDRFSRIRNKRMKRIFDLYISKKGCIDCGIKGPKEIFEFDHFPGMRNHNQGFKTKLINSLKTIFKEMRNGEFVCANCHKIRTHERGQQNGPGNFR